MPPEEKLQKKLRSTPRLSSFPLNHLLEKKMRVVQLGATAHQSLSEYCVGEATDICIYPGIAQCFAIAGNTQSKILGVHVSPGFTAEEMDAAFGYLQAMGGDNVMYWYIVGPFTDHFAVAKAQWRSVKDIKKTFTKKLNNKAASHLILDASDERHTKRLYPGITIPMEFSSIDVKVQVRGATMAFFYRERKRDVTAWTEFDLTKFQRI